MITCAFENGSKTTNLRHTVVHAIVEKDGAILLGKRASFLLEGGRWGLPGGYVDRDETLSQAVLRELLEETGWKGEIISLFRINSSPLRIREDRQNIVVEFLVKPLEKISTPDNETDALEWVPVPKLSTLGAFAFDHEESIQLYLTYRKKPFPLPLLV